MITLSSVLFIFILLLNSQHLFAGIKSDVNVTAKLISEKDTITPGKSFWIAVEFEMFNDWHIYWRNSGDSGLPTSVEWGVLDGFKISKTYYPYPKNLVENNSATFIYENKVRILAEVTPPMQIENKNIKITANADWLECKQACIPGSASLSIELDLRDDQGKNETIDKSFEYWKSKLPIYNSDWKFVIAKKNSFIKISGIKPKWFEHKNYQVSFFPYDENTFNHSEKQIITLGNTGFTLKVELNKFREDDPNVLEGILVISESWLENTSNKNLEVSEKILN
jgi:thiol:disulfide interchange protein DsbD